MAGSSTYPACSRVVIALTTMKPGAVGTRPVVLHYENLTKIIRLALSTPYLAAGPPGVNDILFLHLKFRAYRVPPPSTFTWALKNNMQTIWFYLCYAVWFSTSSRSTEPRSECWRENLASRLRSCQGYSEKSNEAKSVFTQNDARPIGVH